MREAVRELYTKAVDIGDLVVKNGDADTAEAALTTALLSMMAAVVVSLELDALERRKK